jgi:hypothetical protein
MAALWLINTPTEAFKPLLQLPLPHSLTTTNAMKQLKVANVPESVILAVAG